MRGRSSAARARRRRGSSCARSRASWTTPERRTRIRRSPSPVVAATLDRRRRPDVVTETEVIVSQPPGPPEIDAAVRRALAVGLFNHTWTLLEKGDRTPAEDDEMVHAAHASRYHWGEVGEPVNLARGEWQVSRVYSVLGRGEPALYHARRCVELNESNPEREDWEVASAYEGMSRALAVSGDLAGATEWKRKAESALADIAEAEDREVIGKDIATLPV